ncbi:MAG: hypothetical protein RL112_1461 [Planctomycetota bacterium]
MDAAARLALAQDFLREAVYASRAKQAAGAELLRLASPRVKGACGLGEAAALELELSPRAAELYAQLWPAGHGDLRALQAAMERWVVDQDALDRERNHYLKAFRHKHGFDRRAWSKELLAEYEVGLASIAAREDEERLRSAAALG